jgi:hypothetical protein
MRLSTVLSAFCFLASLASGSTLPYLVVGAAPCVYDSALTDPMVTAGGITYDAVGPAGSSFQCGGLNFTNFSGVADIAASYWWFSPRFLYVMLEVDPINAAAGWSYLVSSAVSNPLQLSEVILPALNHVTSGSPTVEEHFCIAPCTSQNDTNFIDLTGPSIALNGFSSEFDPRNVAVFGSDISGGTINGLDTIFVTPEPVSGFLLTSGLFGLVLYGRKRLRVRLAAL